MTKQLLTAKETEIYQYIKLFLKLNGYPPTVREISKGCFLSKSMVYTYLCRMSDKGYLTMEKNKSRTIRVK